MLASGSSFVLPKPVRLTTCLSLSAGGNTCCFDLGPRTGFPTGSTLSLSSINMELLRRVSRGCYNNSRRVKTETDSSGGEDLFSSRTKEVPRHLVIMVNGITGSAADWRYAAEQFVKKLPDKVIVHRSECNSSRLTFDGVDTMGERLAEEVLSVVRRWPEVQKISFVAHSLGGLVARYAIGRLHDNSSKLEPVATSQNCFSEEKTEYSKQCLEQSYQAKIAGLEPMNFITFATPHLGSRGNKQLPLLCGLPFLERRASQTAHLVAGRSGKHLFLMDNDGGKSPLLLRMVDDSGDLKFMSALRAFKRRVAYANANYDYMVGWRTSSIRRQHELPQSNLLVIDEKYPHVVYVEGENIEDICNTSSSNVGAHTVDLEEKMIRGLTQVSWERVHVSFQKSKQRYIAHSAIQDRNTGRTIGTGYESNGLYHLSSPSTVCSATDSPLIIHAQLGHPSLQKLQRLVPSLSKLSSLNCESCQLGKHTRSHFPDRVNKRATSPFALVHSDVWGPSRSSTILGSNYFVTFIDDFSRCTWIFLMKNRSELFSIFEQFFQEIKTQFGVSIRSLRSDNAREYLSHQFQKFMASNGILHQTSCAHTPQQNGVAERKNRHLVETTRTLLLHNHVPNSFWGDAVLTSCYLINRMPSSVLDGKVPLSVLFPHVPLHSLSPRVFGSTCFVHNLTPGLDKLSAKSLKCVFLGYHRSQKGYKCYSPTLRRYFVSADVTFFESVPYFESNVLSPQPLPTVIPTPPVIESPEILPMVIPVPSAIESHDPITQDTPLVNPPTVKPLQVYHRRKRPIQEHLPAPTPASEAIPDSSPAPSPDPEPAQHQVSEPQGKLRRTRCVLFKAVVLGN